MEVKIIKSEQGEEYVELEYDNREVTQIELVKSDSGKTESLVISRESSWGKKKEITISLFGDLRDIKAISNRDAWMKFFSGFSREEEVSKVLRKYSDLSETEIEKYVEQLERLLIECSNLEELVKEINKTLRLFSKIFNKLFECFWK
jgi:hypothetical protein